MRKALRRFIAWYGSDPLHLLVLAGSFALAAYASLRLFDAKPVEVAVWLFGAVVLHDLVLLPLYTLADRSASRVLRHRGSTAPRVPWINHVRVPVVISGLLMLLFFPLILRLPRGIFESITTYTTELYLARYLAIVGGLFLVSAISYAVRLRRARRLSARITQGRVGEGGDALGETGTGGEPE